ncbi:Chitin synthase 8 [Wickerhamiella sorbophila]|uniref:chitin synthase n=1 Tax=Wickerhamiella sorbophila TaxID=45607 RepID=A0A2T0FJQ3_9ASCO|nr:Chitin synthase 8 [Wickerhamiella sorbophila]PRT55224.1 Chitin synthase 8 [Wickerhamiella sorbophila]
MTDISGLPPDALDGRGITSHIASQYHQGIPFSTVSTRALVAVNTFTPLDVNQDQVFRQFAAQICNRMELRGESQVVCFLGEHGTGKSEFASAITRHILTLAGNPLSSRIRKVQPILEAFSTVKNSSSTFASKMGLNQELQYDKDSNLIGCTLMDFRLERSRVTKIPTNERNYHVFYYMVNGLTDEERYHLQLTDVANNRFRYLGHPSQLRQAGIDDRIKLKQLKSSLYSLGFSRSDVANIFQILAAILHLGQVQFRMANMDYSVAQGTAVEVGNPDIVEVVATFLGVDPDVLTQCLVTKTVTINKDRVTIVLDQRGARENCDEIARTLYTLLVSWIFEHINRELSRNAPGASAADYDPIIQSTISIVDFPGFNTASTPALDCLLHNTANEMLYHYMMYNYFTKSDDVLGREDVEVSSTEYFDNTETVRTLVRPSLGLLSVINDYAQRDKEDVQLMDSISKRFKDSRTVMPYADTNSFVVNHFDGEVEYSVKGLLDDAKEAISAAIINLINSSTSSGFLKDVFEQTAVITDTFGESHEVVGATLSSEPRRQPSLINRDGIGRQRSQRYSAAEEQRRQATFKGTRNARIDAKKQKGSAAQFVLALDNMLETFEDHNAYFVLCIKPNDHRLSNSFDARAVRQQVTGLGIPDIAKRTKFTDLSLFSPFHEYLELARMNNLTAFDTPQVGESERVQAIKLIQRSGWSERDIQAGTTGVFLSEGAWLALVDPTNSFAERAAKKFANDPEDQFKEAYMYDDLETRSMAGGFSNMFKFAGSSALLEDNGEALDEAEDFTAPQTTSPSRRLWMTIVWLYTFWVPEFFIKLLGGMKFKSVRIAWREKFTINLIIWGMCAGCVLFLIGFPFLICPLQNVMSAGELAGYSYQSNTKHVYTAIRGTIYDITHFASAHYPSIVPTGDILNYGGKISSDLFPMQISAVCGGVNGTMSEFIVMGDPNNYTDVNAQYHDFRSFTNDSRPDWYLEKMEFFNKNLLKSYIGYTPEDVKKMAENQKKSVASLNGFVYDFTDYISGNVYTKAPAGYVPPPNINKDFMQEDLVNLFLNFAGQDVSGKYRDLDIDDQVRDNMNRCMHNVFMIGKLDTRGSAKCMFARYFLLAITCFVVAIILIKFLAALQFGSYEYPDDLDRFIICQVPVYTEDEKSLRRAIDSLARTKYDDKRKILVIVCDGNIRGAGNDKTTPELVLDILGGSEGQDPPALSLEGLGDGDQQYNMGKIYYGVYEVGGHLVPYLVLVKVGKPNELRPGNRGKRDSQMILMRFLNRVHHNTPMSPFELELYRHFEYTVGVNPAYYEYIMQVDADTIVSPESLSQLVGKMVRDNRIQAVCGETALSNARHSLVTMIQVYEYYISHNLAKAFESLFGSVTCLPGCFSLYRIYEQRTSKPIFVSNPIVDNYAENNVRTLHTKNLLHLGEDRYLTTLLLKYNPQYSTKFLRHAQAWTIAPDTWSVFLSQRRRWINSTVHNLVELVPMSQLCGFCFFSMRFIVLIDLFSTLIQPVTCAYLAYLIYLCSSRSDDVPWTSIAMLCGIYGLQAIIFVLRRKWEMVGWMFVYLLAIPIFSLALPLYAFWYMDDFSWGSTRVVVDEKGQMAVISEEGAEASEHVPLRLWADYKSELERREMDEKVVDSDAVSYYPATLNRSASGVSLDSYRTRASMLATEDYDQTNFANQPTDADLTAAIRDILATADLTKVTKRTVRAQLERQFNCKLNMRKEYISRATEALLSGEL